MDGYFRFLAQSAAAATGAAWAFIAALALIVGWVAVGPVFGFSDTWQLVINTTTTIITFLMVFLIQNTQNRDAKVLQLKLDELLRAVKGARDSFVDLEELSDEELKQVAEEFRYLHARYGNRMSRFHRQIQERVDPPHRKK